MEVKTKIRRFDEPPFIQERTMCGINALIDVLKMPVSQLTTVNSSLIALKYLEISNGEETYLTVAGQSLHLQYLVEKLCKDDETIERVMEMCENAFLPHQGAVNSLNSDPNNCLKNLELK